MFHTFSGCIYTFSLNCDWIIGLFVFFFLFVCFFFFGVLLPQLSS